MNIISKYLNHLIVFLVVVIGIGFLVQHYKQKSQVVDRSVQEQVSPSKAQELVNKHLKEAAYQKKLQELKAQQGFLNSKSQSTNQATKSKKEDIDPSQIPAEQQIWKDPANEITQGFGEENQEVLNEQNNIKLNQQQNKNRGVSSESTPQKIDYDSNELQNPHQENELN